MTLNEALRRALDRRTHTGRPVAELIVEVVVAKALAGDIQAIRLVFEIDRSEGPEARGAESPVAGRIDIESAVARPIPPRRRRAV
jgi:hypothetical protein